MFAGRICQNLESCNGQGGASGQRRHFVDFLPLSAQSCFGSCRWHSTSATWWNCEEGSQRNLVSYPVPLTVLSSASISYNKDRTDMLEEGITFVIAFLFFSALFRLFRPNLQFSFFDSGVLDVDFFRISRQFIASCSEMGKFLRLVQRRDGPFRKLAACNSCRCMPVPAFDEKITAG